VLGVSVTLQAVGIGHHFAGTFYKALMLDNNM
jgi:hypothetical protein